MRVTIKMILDTMQQGFAQINERFERMDERFERMDERFERMDERFERMDERFERLEGKFDDLSTVVFTHEYKMNDFLTRDEFNVFKSENAAAHDRTAKTLERLEQEFKAFNKAHARLENRVDRHEKALVEHHLLTV